MGIMRLIGSIWTERCMGSLRFEGYMGSIRSDWYMGPIGPKGSLVYIGSTVSKGAGILVSIVLIRGGIGAAIRSSPITSDTFDIGMDVGTFNLFSVIFLFWEKVGGCVLVWGIFFTCT